MKSPRLDRVKMFLLTLVPILIFSLALLFWIWLPTGLSVAVESQLQSAKVQASVKGQLGGPQILLLTEILTPIILVTMSGMVIYRMIKQED